MKNKKLLHLTFAAMLAAISVVLKLLNVNVTLLGGLVKEINLSPAVIMFSGMALGPVYGGAVGALTDVLGWLINPQGGYIPIFTVTNALVGIIPYFLFNRKKPLGFAKVLLSVAVTQFVCSFILNTLTLIFLGFMPAKLAWFRALSTFLFIPVHTVIIYLAFRAMAGTMKKLDPSVQSE